MKLFMVALAVAMAGVPVCRGSAGDAAGGINALACDLYGRLRTDEGNLFFSPYSLSTALAMTWAGARGATEQEMARTLHFDADQGRLHAAYGQLLERLNAGGRPDAFELDVANRLWGQSGYPILPAFQETVKRFYGADLAPADFRGDADGARGEINAWVAQKTRDRIRDLVPPGILSELTRLVLVNAIYFKGDWARTFETNATTAQPFTLAGGGRADTPMMRQVERFRHAEAGGVQVLELPYKGQALSMIVLLPRAADGLKALEDALTPANLRRWTDALESKRVDVWLPRFTATARFALSKTLGELGMPGAFTPDADFSGMTGGQDLYITEVLHQAFVDVNEQGTEAAAATAVVMQELAMRPRELPVEFKADHPFVFLIRDNSSGAVLFLGRLVNPGP